MPSLSVIMAVYNGQKYLGESIESILNQTFRDFEFIVIDDASTDATGQIIKKFMNEDNRILLINNETNLERAESRNKGIRSAKGDYVAIIDSDDISDTDKLARQIEFLEKHEDIGFVGTSWYCIDEDGRELSLNKCSVTVCSEAVHFMCNPSIMVRRSILETVGGYRAEFVPAEDYDLWLRASEISGVANIADPLFKYRVHSSSSTSRQKPEMEMMAALAIEMAEERRRTGHDSLTALNRQEARQNWVSKFNTSGLTRRRLVSLKFSTWSRAGFAIGDYGKAVTYAKNAVKAYPLNFQAGAVILKVIKRIIYIRLLKRIVENIYHFSSCARKKILELSSTRH